MDFERAFTRRRLSVCFAVYDFAKLCWVNFWDRNGRLVPTKQGNKGKQAWEAIESKAYEKPSYFTGLVFLGREAGVVSWRIV